MNSAMTEPRRKRPTAAAAAARLLAAFALGCAVVPSLARAPAVPAAAAAVLKARFPDLQVLSHAIGPLHAKDARDVAVVLGRVDRGRRLVAVLWGDAAGGYRFSNASGDVDAACAGCDVEVRIRDATLEVGTSDPGADLATVRTWRFAYRGVSANVLRLVGVRTEQLARSEPAHAFEQVASADLLTGEKVDTAEGMLDGRATRRETRTHVPLRQVIVFDQFAFEFRGDAPETHLAFDRGFLPR